MEQQKLSERLLEAERRHVDALAAAEARQQEMDAQAGQLTALQDRLAATDEAAAAAQTMRTALEVRCGNGVRWGNMQGPLNARSPEQRVPWLQGPPTQARVQEAVRASESAQQRLEAAEQELRAAHAQLQEATQRTEAAEAALMELQYTRHGQQVRLRDLPFLANVPHVPTDNSRHHMCVHNRGCSLKP